MPEPRPLISDTRRQLEIAAVVLTAACRFLPINWLEWKLPFIVVATVGWTTYVLLRRKRMPGILQYWGFRADNFREVLKIVLPFGIISVVTFVLLGIYLDTINLTWHIVPVLLLYPVWGTIQQFLVIGLVAGNLKDLSASTLPKPVTILLPALLFGLIHYPFNWLIVGTFLLAGFYGYVYWQSRNLYVLGLFHGWLGGLFFYTVVGRDPFVEVFGKFF
ncbi:MAG TPA: CPBP family intramembrane glutamic endopeptidase [Chryseosolibacter sp.]|nr:CPBP family intramembrane glutamic endopeptidase [Chryseosolibacter sp.]